MGLGSCHDASCCDVGRRCRQGEREGAVLCAFVLERSEFQPPKARLVEIWVCCSGSECQDAVTMNRPLDSSGFSVLGPENKQG